MPGVTVPRGDITAEDLQLQLDEVDAGRRIVITVHNQDHRIHDVALVLHRNKAFSAPWYMAEWRLDPKALPAQVVMNIAAAVGNFVCDRNRE